MAPPLTQPSKCGCKHVGIPAQSVPLPSLAPPPSALAPIAWYTAHTLPGMQATVHNAAAPTSSAATNLPLQTLEWHHVHTDTSSAPQPPSTPPAWYPISTAYHPRMYAHAPYHSAYPFYWSYGYYLPSQPHLPPPQ